jgi:hypothetical protein
MIMYFFSNAIPSVKLKLKNYSRITENIQKNEPGLYKKT